MVTQREIQNFLSQKSFAMIGVSRDKNQFANSAYRLMKSRGYTVYPINPYTEQAEGDQCYPNIKSLPERVDAALVMLPPEKTMMVLPDIAQAGIRHVWLQQQTDSPQAIQFCIDRKINVVYGECIMMFFEPLAFPHRLHRWGKKVFGSLPN